MKKQEWKTQWGHEIMKSRYPNVFKLKEGRCLVRARVKDPQTGKLKELKKVLPQATETEASLWLEESKKAVRSRTAPDVQQTPPFASYAITVLRDKATRRELSLENQDRWKHALRHLIGGIHAEEDKKRERKPVVSGFGDVPVAAIRVKHVEAGRRRSTR